MSRLVHYFLFSKARGKIPLWQQEKIFAIFSPFDAFLLNIRNIFMKYDLIQLLKINMEMNFLLLTYSQEKAVGKCLLMFKL